MPYVSVRITKGGVTTKQKARIVHEITQTLQNVLGKKPEHTHIIIDEVEEAHSLVDSVSRDFKRLDLTPAPLAGEIGDPFDDESLVRKAAFE